MATQGLQVFNSDGTLRVDVGSQLGRVLGTRNVTGRTPTWPYRPMAWPFPTIPVANRLLLTASNEAQSNNVLSTAWALLDANGNITYDQADDRQPITLIFMVC